MTVSVFAIQQIKTIAVFESEHKAIDFLNESRSRFIDRCVNEDGLSTEQAEKEFDSRLFIVEKEL